MLDDLKKIAQVDKSDALGVAEKQAQQLRHEYNVSFQATTEVRNVVLSGMGGSALPAVILNSWPRLNVPFEICRGYDIPKYVNENTLHIISSFSGTTEETLESLDKALKSNAQIVVMASAGTLAEKAQELNLPLFRLPVGLQPRMSSLYFLKAFVELLEAAKLVAEGSLSELAQTADWLEKQHDNWLPTVPTSQNLAKQIAEKLVGKSVIMYSGPLLFPAANKWKIFINECAKNTAWVNQYPEFCHNEFIGWSSHPVEKPFAVVELRSNLEHPRVQKRFDVAEKLLSGKRPAPIAVDVVGDSVLKQILWVFNLGDFVSVYLAILNNVDPTPVDLVEKFKKELD